jgi:crotonobetainyl-CoA:carnitine CoA-transferase CaiB-like acyl-CoA transferase
MTRSALSRGLNRLPDKIAAMPGPLAGIRVIDMTSIVMGPLATVLMADLGAEVIKVEPPSGDSLRHVGYPNEPGNGPLHWHLNRGKRSVVADIGTPDGRANVLDLCASADVFATNVRPAALARAELTYDDVRKVNDHIVYASMVGYGTDGPLGARPAYDDLMQGEAGIAWAMSQTGNDAPRFVPYNVCDRSVGLYAFGCINAALVARERSGHGEHIEIPMFETMVSLVMGEHLNGATFDPPTGPTGYQRIMTASRKPYRTTDGWVAALVYTTNQWRAFCALVGAGGKPSGGIEAEQAFLAAAFAKRSCDDWLTVLVEADVPVAPINSFDDLLANDHLAAVGYWQNVDGIRTPRVPSRWTNSTPDPLRAAPQLGESNTG